MTNDSKTAAAQAVAEIPDSVIAKMELAYFAAQEGVPLAKRATVGMRAALEAYLADRGVEWGGGRDD